MRDDERRGAANHIVKERDATKAILEGRSERKAVDSIAAEAAPRNRPAMGP